MTEINFPFLKHTGASLKSFSKGEAEVELNVEPYHLQHKGFVHGGVISTLMDIQVGTLLYLISKMALRLSQWK